MATTVVGNKGVGQALTKIVGWALFCLRRRAYISTPDALDMRISQIRQDVASASPDARNSLTET